MAGDSLDNANRRYVPMVSVVLGVAVPLFGLIVAGVTFRTDALNTDRDHDERIESLEEQMKVADDRQDRLDRNLIRIGERLGVRDLERP